MRKIFHEKILKMLGIEHWSAECELQKLPLCYAASPISADLYQVAFRQLHPLCNTLCVEVNPWCLVVNRLGVTLHVKVSDTSIFGIAPNSVFSPPSMSSTFRFGVADESVGEGDEPKIHFGPPLQLTDQVKHLPTVQ